MPTLVMMANSAATAGVALAYVAGNQKYKGNSAALRPNTTHSNNNATENRVVSAAGRDWAFTATSAIFRVPVVP